MRVDIIDRRQSKEQEHGAPNEFTSASNQVIEQNLMILEAVDVGTPSASSPNSKLPLFKIRIGIRIVNNRVHVEMHIRRAILRHDGFGSGWKL